MFYTSDAAHNGNDIVASCRKRQTLIVLAAFDNTNNVHEIFKKYTSLHYYYKLTAMASPGAD